MGACIFLMRSVFFILKILRFSILYIHSAFPYHYFNLMFYILNFNLKLHLTFAIYVSWLFYVQVQGEIQEIVKTGLWVGDCFIYTSSVNRLNYFVGGEIVTIAHLDR